MKIKRIIAYLLYLSCLLLLIVAGGKYLQELRVLAGREFNPLPPMIFSAGFSVFMGMYMALPGLADTLMKSGQLRLDWLKVLVIGIPTLLITASGILYYYLGWDFGLLLPWINIQYNGIGVAFIGAIGGYTLLSSITKEEEVTETISTEKNRIPKIVTLVILGSFILYISLHGIIQPVKLAEINADIVTTDDQAGYLVKEGKETVYLIKTDIIYTLQFENMPYGQYTKHSGRDSRKIWIEPKEKLEALLEEDMSKILEGTGFSGGGSKTEITLRYNLGSIDPQGNHPDKEPPSPEVLAQIKNALYDAVLVVQFDDQKIERYDLSAYKKE